ncbi:hypothetical protein AVEN_265782-1 [Araneus ventricosus]|uniref:Uncharacterized protein n=1 Tax=Araneus ventricosus TaxID=182803 RepID=A0A4Y2L928_ARAVE|nr:hypothetical protein AVEN_265782-1 [Araneus ventricosus]
MCRALERFLPSFSPPICLVLCSDDFPKFISSSVHLDSEQMISANSVVNTWDRLLSWHHPFNLHEQIQSSTHGAVCCPGIIHSVFTSKFSVLINT